MFPAEGGTKTFTISTNTSTTISSYPSWTTVTRSGNTVTVTCGPNCGYSRGGAVVVSSPYAGAGCSVSQTGSSAPTATASGGGTIAYGGSKTLTVTGNATTFKWQPGNYTGTSYTVSPSATTTYTVTGTNPCGTSSPSSVTVYVTPPPDYITLSPSSLSFPYTGGTKTFTISTNTSSQTLSYPSWMTVTRSGNTVTVSCGRNCGSFRGDAVVVSSQYAGAGCSVTQAAGVSATANAGQDLSICPDETTAQLGGSVSGSATTGIWSSSVGGDFHPSATYLNATWTPLSGYSGTAKLTLTTTDGCGPASDSKNVYVTAPVVLATASGNTNQNVCVGSPILNIQYAISNATDQSVSGLPPGVDWIYSGGYLIISGTPTVAESYDYTVTASNINCPNSEKEETGLITVTPAATANAGPQCPSIYRGGTTIPLGGSVGGSATSGTWSSSPVGTFNPSPTDLNATWTAPADFLGTATLTLTTSGGCGTATASKSQQVYPPMEFTPPSELHVSETVSETTLSVLNGGLAAGGAWKWYNNYNTLLTVLDTINPTITVDPIRSTRYRVRGEKWVGGVLSKHTYFISNKVQITKPDNNVPNLPTDKNYITTYSPVKSITGGISNLPLEEQGIVVQYFDGLGRPTQTVAVNQSYFFNDLVTGVGYDSYGRQDKAYLPATNPGNGIFVDNQENLITGFYNTAHNEIDGLPALQGDRIATATIYEKSPLNRVDTIIDPAGGKTYFLYGTNLANTVPKWKIVNANDCYRDPNDRFYAANELYMTQTTDPSEKIVKEYKDKLGQVVMKDAGGKKTCYIYDDFGLLRYVLSPEATNKMASGTYTPDNDIIKGLGYYYQYDKRKRMIKKQLPGAEPVRMIYDVRDRLVLLQDGETYRTDSSKWLYTKFEHLNRPTETGWLFTTRDWENLKSSFENTIDINTLGFSFGNILTETKYDTYPVDAPPCSLLTKNISVKGMVTYTKSKILDTSGGNYETYYFYDDKYRVIQTNTKGGPIEEIIKNTYDFVGNLTESTETYSGEVNSTITRWFTYDHAGRLEKVEQQIEGDSENGKVVLAQNDYNELGQLMLKKLHMAKNINYKQDIDYAYDIRGWLKSINNLTDNTFRKLYAQELDYKENGNINRMTWKNTTLNINGSVENGIERTYAFGYDALNRLNEATYSQIEYISGTPTPSGSQFNVIFPTPYDDNGNITKLIRFGNKAAAGESYDFGIIDDLTYTYELNSNRISSVADNATGVDHDLHFKAGTGTETYTYDGNGNATYIPDKNVSINYNYLNLPNTIGTISYLYSASGNKLKKTHGTSDTYYQGSVLTINDNPIVLNPEGRAVWNSSTSKWEYEYDVKDHLGNTRVSFAPTATNVKVLQKRDYYPFGMEMANWYPSDANATKFRYNGKELQDEGGLGWYDYGARFYDPALARWHSVDPLAEKWRRMSPYNYAANNPIRFIDPDGMEMTDFMDKDKNLIKHIEDGSNAVFTQTGEGSGIHYEFSGFDEKQGGENNINFTTAVQEQQNLNNENPGLEQNADGNGETHCNQSTQNVLKTAASALNDKSLAVDGRANTMIDKISSGKVANLIPASLEGAKSNAKAGGLSIIGYKSDKGSGHILTFSVGENIKRGETQNIGPKKYSGFVSLNAAISKSKTKSYYIYAPNLINEITVKP